MSRRTKNIIGDLVARSIRRTVRRRGGVGALVILAALFLIGLLDPDLRDKLSSAVQQSAGSAVLTKRDNEPLGSNKKSPLKEGVWTVVHIADGDTLDVQDGTGTKYRIRLIGANTPETVKPNHPIEPFGPEASAFTKRVIAAADNKVRIAFDGDQIDKYGRNLAMVYLQMPTGEVWLNGLLVREGLAKAELQYRFSKGAKEKLRLAEADAKSAKKNMWSEPAKPAK
jgi:micrococcal nuclease